MPDIKIFTDNIDQKAMDQINLLISQPAFKDGKIRIMPDVHAGAGCVIGFTADLGEKVIPNVVGVDIGCGMLTIRLESPIDPDYVDKTIREKIPSGQNVHSFPTVDTSLLGIYCYPHLKNVDWLNKSMGTLGGGNHFIEVDVDSDGSQYLVIHTGSRNLGKQIAEYYQNLAISRMKGGDLFKEEAENLIHLFKMLGRQSEISSALKELRANQLSRNPTIPDSLCYLEGEDRAHYLHDMRICQDWALINRNSIANALGFGKNYPHRGFHTTHNYIDSFNIIRKGAVSAHEGELLVIPMNMRDGTLLCRGKGSDDWNMSAPHGAGRVMSRAEAKRTLSLSDYQSSMVGIFTTTADISTIDEAPMAYKPMDEIVSAIGDTVEVIDALKPIYNYKASE